MPGSSGGRKGGSGPPGKGQDNNGSHPDNKPDTIADDKMEGIGEKVRKAAYSQVAHEESRNYPAIGMPPLNDKTEKIKEAVAWIKPRFDEFIKPFPSEWTELLNTLDNVIAMFPTVSSNGSGSKGASFSYSEFENITSSIAYMTHWEGALSKELIDWLKDLNTIVNNQALVLNLLRNDLLAMREIYAKARKDVHKIGEDAITAFENCKGMGGGDSIAILLTVLGAFAGIASAGLGYVGKAGASLGAAVVAGGIGIGPGVTPDDKEVPLGGNYADDVMDNIKDALDEVEKTIKDKESELIKSMDSNAEILGGFVTKSHKVANPIAPLIPSVMLASNKELKDGITQI